MLPHLTTALTGPLLELKANFLALSLGELAEKEHA